MVAFTNLPVFAAALVGVIAIAAILWLQARREERRRQLVKSVESILSDEAFRRAGEDPLQRAA